MVRRALPSLFFCNTLLYRYSDLNSTQSGNFTIVWENHNPISAAKFEAEVHVAVYRDWISHVGGAVGGGLAVALRIARSSFTALSDAYSFIRPASCRTAARSGWSLALASNCRSFLGSIDGSLLALCQALSSGHVALVLIVLVNALCYVPSLADQHWWALNSSRPKLRTLFTYQFAHANLQHIAGNMLTLLFVGTEVSESLNCDHIFFILFYLLCGLAGGLFAVWFSRAGVSTVGASGSVSGMIVALSVLRPNSAVAILGDINASSPLLLLAGTLLADLQRLGVSWQVRSYTACSAIARVRAQCFILRAFILRLGRGISAAALQAISWPLCAFGGCEQWRRESEVFEFYKGL